jgi:hypothetical protein
MPPKPGVAGHHACRSSATFRSAVRRLRGLSFDLPRGIFIQPMSPRCLHIYILYISTFTSGDLLVDFDLNIRFGRRKFNHG